MKIKRNHARTTPGARTREEILAKRAEGFKVNPVVKNPIKTEYLVKSTPLFLALMQRAGDDFKFPGNRVKGE
jgi:hypothetical protein